MSQLVDLFPVNLISDSGVKIRITNIFPLTTDVKANRRSVAITVELEAIAVALQRTYWSSISAGISRQPIFSALAACIARLTGGAAYSNMDQYRVLIQAQFTQLGLKEFNRRLTPAVNVDLKAQFSQLDYDVRN